MDPQKPKLPIEAVQLYNQFIHGDMSRRAFMDGIQRIAGGLAAATIIDALMPNYALGQQVSRTDDRIKASYETVPSPQGNGSIKGYFVRPVSADTRSATPSIFVSSSVWAVSAARPFCDDVCRAVPALTTSSRPTSCAPASLWA